ncbi:MAG TPA: hypothetical protein VF166_13745 [Gemmatimonadaceae bacterium]
MASVRTARYPLDSSGTSVRIGGVSSKKFGTIDKRAFWFKWMEPPVGRRLCART